jgi:hypothetical protein
VLPFVGRAVGFRTRHAGRIHRRHHPTSLERAMTDATTALADTPFAPLAAEGRLLNRLHLGATRKPGRTGFRGELALKFAQQFSDEARPPEIKADQVMALADASRPGFAMFACYLHSFEYLKLLAEVLGDTLRPDGKYFVFCNNIDLSTRYRCEYGGATFHVLPIDEATVYNELLDLIRLDRNDLKKLDTAGKLDRVADAAAKFKDSFPPISFEDGVKVMLPLRNALENRPV